jgi:hypothetical protein
MEVTVGDRVTLVGRGTHNQMRQRTHDGGGIYDVGMAEIEKGTVTCLWARPEPLSGPGAGHGNRPVAQGPGPGKERHARPGARHGAYEMISWPHNFPELTQTMETKGAVMDALA